MELGEIMQQHVPLPEGFLQPGHVGPLASPASPRDICGVWQINLTEGLVRCDEQAAALLGAAPSVDLPANLPTLADLFAGVRSVADLLSTSSDDIRPGHIEIARPGRVLWVFVMGHTGAEHHQVCGIVLDATAGDALRQRSFDQECRLEAIVNNLPGICYRCSLDPPWRLTFVNAEVETITGFPPRAFHEGKDWESLIHPDDRSMVRAEVAAAVAERRRFDIRYRIFDRQGRVRWVYERGLAICNSRGRPSEIEGFIFDISESILMREALAQAEERYRLVCQATMDVIYEHDLNRRKIVCHGEFGNVLGYEADQLTTDSKWWQEQIHPDDAPRVMTEMATLLAGDGNHYVSEHRFRRTDGSYADVLATAIIMRDEAGKPQRMIGALQDLSARKAMHKALTESEALNRSIVSSSHDCIKLLDLEGRLLFINEIGLQALGASDVDALLGRPLASFWPAPRRSTIRRAIKRAAAGRTGRFSGWCPTLTGTERAWDVIISPIPGPDGKPAKLLAISRDMTQHLESERRLQEAATVDALTGLPNRRQFIDTLDAWITRNAQQNTAIGLMILDLDGFKQINDTFGHDAGDALLLEVAMRLRSFVCDDVFCARLAGDEFALIIGGLADGTDLLPMANRILEDLRQPFSHAHRLLDGKATMGLATWPADGLNSADLLKAADMALYAAKRQNPGTAVRFVPAHRAEMRSRAAMVRRAREAISRSAITPHYQPIVCVKDGQIAGHEALLRLNRPGSRSCLQPSAIMAAFEDPELATAISRAMLESIVRDMATWLDAGIDFGSVSLNATAADLGNPYFAETLLGSLAASGIPNRLLKLEVTETVFLGRGAESARRSIDWLCAEGIRVVLDDFGTGHASLVHLRELPIQGLKIDRSFIASLHNDPRDQAVVDALIRLGLKLDLEVVAEGVENRTQAQQLRAMGCRLMQGFLYSPAVPADRVGRQLHHR